jgi:transcription factor SPT20
MPNSLKRKAAAMVDVEEDETEKAKRAKVLQFMNPQANRGVLPMQPK